MSKFIALIGLFAFVGYANAFPLLGEITGQRFIKHHKINPSAQTCANFAGIWKGTCQTANADSKDQQFEIMQEGCDYIGTKEMQLPIGGVVQFDMTTPTTSKEPTEITHATASFAWNVEKDAFDLRYPSPSQRSRDNQEAREL